MKKKGKLIALILVCVFAMTLLAACGNGTTPATPDAPAAGNGAGGGQDAGGGDAATPVDPEQVLSLHISQDSGTLNPLNMTGGFTSARYLFYEPLWNLLDDGSFRWVLATGIDTISDVQHTLHLRQGVTFSNGNPFTAADVIFSLEANRDHPQAFANVRTIDFDNTSIIDDYTIDLWFTMFDIAQKISLAHMMVMNEASFDDVALSRDPIGTGPYVLVDYVVNSHLSVTAREGYWGNPPRTRNLMFRVINEEAQIVNALETGLVDFANIPITDADYVESLGLNVEVIPSMFNLVAMYSMLPGNPLDTKEARWAVSHAIDRDAINHVLFRGRTTISDFPGSIAGPDFEERFLFPHETYSIGFSPERARELAEYSGLVGQTLRLITNGSPQHNTIAEIIQANLSDIGVYANIISFDMATYFGILMDASNFEIAIFMPSAPTNMVASVLAGYLGIIPQGWSGYYFDYYRALSARALRDIDPEDRREALYQSVYMFAEWAPWFGLVESITVSAMVPELRGVQRTLANTLVFEYLYLVG